MTPCKYPTEDDSPVDAGLINDLNGNNVGSWRVVEDSTANQAV